MTKSLTIAFLFLNIGIIFSQKEDTITATFDGWDDNSYYFIDNSNEVIDFDTIDVVVLKKYDLRNDSYVGEKFNIIFKKEVKNNLYDSIEIRRITTLELIK